jgi:DNA-binding MarR family transcriptional regulator
VCWLALLLADRVKSSFSAHASAAGFTVIQAKILLQLQPGDGLPMHTLASQVQSDPSNLTAPIDKLEGRGAIRRQPRITDRRVKSIILTDEGCRLRDELWNEIITDPGPIAHLSADQVTGLQQLLRAAVYAPPSAQE